MRDIEEVGDMDIIYHTKMLAVGALAVPSGTSSAKQQDRLVHIYHLISTSWPIRSCASLEH